MTRYQNDIILPDIYDSQLEEKKIIKFWHKQKIFENITSSRRKKNDGKFSFHNGPVFPTGFPHSGNIFNSTVKDVLTRYGQQKNLQVDNRPGWDCHGLAVEYEVEKKLDIRSPEDIQKLGIAAYNEECRNFVHRHSSDWNSVTKRMGNCVDFTNEYKTLSTDYMENVWRVFKQLYENGLVYRDTKVLPYSTACFTHLSNFEAQQNCKQVTEEGMTISVNIVDSDEKLLIWTTTPWALLSNSAICVNPKVLYLKVKVGDVVYILAKSQLQFVFINTSEYTVLGELLGESLQDLQYEPLFDRLTVPKTNCLPILPNLCTGIVPYNQCHVKKVTYKKQHCWRSGTPLITKRVESWFVRVEAIANDLQKNISEVNWFSRNDVKEQMQENFKDWAISRTRTWGTPIPIWSSASGDEVVCVGSIEELEQLAGKTGITDLHREYVDWIKIPSQIAGNPPLCRVSEVFDCWFESAVMPFTLQQANTGSFQADFVAEGCDQSRGWFYTMLVLSTALSQPPPFRNVYATGIVQEPDGSKVSKRKHNNNDALRLVEKYGADAVRLYFLSMSTGEPFTIQEGQVANITKTLIKPLFRIFFQCTTKLGCAKWVNYGYITEWYGVINPIDHWILSYTEGLLKFYDEEMKAYRLHTVIPKLALLLQQIENWYMPMRQPDSKTNGSPCILFNVIYRICLMFAPFAPFISEYIYQLHRQYIVLNLRKESIHDALLLSPNKDMISPKVEKAVYRLQEVVELVRALREHYIAPIQYLISEVVVIHHRDEYRFDIEYLKEYIAKLINAREIRISKNHHEFNSIYEAELSSTSEHSGNKQIASAIRALSDKEIASFIDEQYINILNHDIFLEDVQIRYQVQKAREMNYVITQKQDLIVVMKMKQELLFYEAGTVKEFTSRIISLKKKAGYYPRDSATIYYSTSDGCLLNVIGKYKESLKKNTNCNLKSDESSIKNANNGCIEEAVDIKGLRVNMRMSINSN